MKSRILAAIAIFALCCTFNVFAADAQKTDDAKKAEMDAMMKAWMAYSTPGDAQKMMGTMAGTWDTEVKSYMDPSQPPMVTKGTSTFTMIMDGRYMQEMAEGSFMNMPFHGMGVYGYDNAMKKYVTTWVDNMGTGIMNSTGTSDDGGKTIKYTGSMMDPMSGKMQNYHMEMHRMGDDQAHYEMWGPAPDGKDAKMMEITYTRKK